MKLLKFLSIGILLMGFINCSNIPILNENFDFGSIAGSNNFKPFIDGFEGSKQVFTKSSNKWVSLYYNWKTDKSEIERNVYRGLNFIGTNEILENVSEYKPVMQPHKGNVYLYFFDGKLFITKYEIGSYGHSNPAPEELVTNKTGNKKLTKIFKSIQRELGQGNRINSNNIYMEWENDTVIVQLTEDCVLYSFYKPLYNQFLPLYEAKEQEIQKERQLAEQRRIEEEQQRIQKERQLAEQMEREKIQYRKEMEAKLARGAIRFPQCYNVPAGIKSYLKKGMKIMGCYRHWSGELVMTWVDLNNNNKCDQFVLWTQEAGFYMPIDSSEDCTTCIEDYKEVADFIYESNS